MVMQLHCHGKINIFHLRVTPMGLYQIRLGKYIIVKARRSAGGRRQEENNYGIKTGFSITASQGILQGKMRFLLSPLLAPLPYLRSQ